VNTIFNFLKSYKAPSVRLEAYSGTKKVSIMGEEEIRSNLAKHFFCQRFLTTLATKKPTRIRIETKGIHITDHK